MIVRECDKKLKFLHIVVHLNIKKENIVFIENFHFFQKYISMKICEYFNNR